MFATLKLVFVYLTLGLIAAVVLLVLSPRVWVSVIGYKEAIFPYNAPAPFSMPLAFFVSWLVSVLDRSPKARGVK